MGSGQSAAAPSSALCAGNGVASLGSGFISSKREVAVVSASVFVGGLNGSVQEKC